MSFPGWAPRNGCFPVGPFENNPEEVVPPETASLAQRGGLTSPSFPVAQEELDLAAVAAEASRRAFLWVWLGGT